METLYNKNGLVFWNASSIRIRNMIVDYISNNIFTELKGQNKAFDIMQIEAPLLTPVEFINKNYTKDDYFSVSDELVLRPETTMGSYIYAKYLLSHTEFKTRLPLCIWQHGKSFRNEQDQPLSKMKLKEFYQLEFQCIYGLTTANDYSEAMVPLTAKFISDLIGPCRIENSDRLPDYSEQTLDIVCEKTNMEVCSISKRKDFEGAKVLEIACGTDRMVMNFLTKY